MAEEAARLIGLLCGDPSGEPAWDAGVRASARTGACPTCGREPASDGTPRDAARESVCRYCPVCQLVGFVRGISPEIIDRIADAVDLVSGGLRDLAESRRGCTTSPPATEDPAGPPP